MQHQLRGGPGSSPAERNGIGAGHLYIGIFL
jgi:hypothetical protein